MRVRLVDSDGGLEEWSPWWSGNSTRWVPGGQLLETEVSGLKEVTVEVEMRRSGATSGPILYSIRGQFVL